jgi:hypothetical protein
MNEQFVPTPVGSARLDWYPAAGTRMATAVLGHGNASGVEAADLQGLAQALPPLGVTVVLVTQPYRLEGNPGVGASRPSTRAWTAVWPRVSGHGTPVIAGGRSAGSQVACRTAATLGAEAVLALAYPLLGPGSPAELLATDRPTLVIQGGRDPFGRPDQFPPLPVDMELVTIPSAGHMFSAGAAGGGPPEVAQLTAAVIEWLDWRMRLVSPVG